MVLNNTFITPWSTLQASTHGLEGCNHTNKSMESCNHTNKSMESCNGTAFISGLIKLMDITTSKQFQGKKLPASTRFGYKPD
jgi:hypothetical protein